MQVIIDKGAGFCFGVARSILQAETAVSNAETLFCLGELVHNEEELKRLENLGVQFIDRETFKKIKNVKILLRAHGEPPETYELAKANNLELIDATCPIVSKLQQRVMHSYEQTKAASGQVAIFGNENHPEVEGLTGHIDKNAIILSSEADIDKINYNLPVHLFSQTTKDAEAYEAIVSAIEARFKSRAKGLDTHLYTNKSLCRQVSQRIPDLRVFASSVDVLIFVAGKNSSNGKQLYEQCLKTNKHSFFISSVSEIEAQWFDGMKKVGISGATSTPEWLLNEVADAIRQWS